MTDDIHRPALHFTPPANWMNDPCGLVYDAGTYHLYYQHNPGENRWGSIHWGHAVSDDLLHWHDRPIAIAPHPEFGMPFTGSCVNRGDNRLTAIYTGALPGAAGERWLQLQCLATSENGDRWQPEGVVIPNPGLPDFRDPKVGLHPETGDWYLVLAAGDEVIFYSSSDLREWTRESSFGRGMGYNEGEWECPDLFPLPRPGTSTNPKAQEYVWVLVVHEGRGLSSPHAGAQYIIGTFDGKSFSPLDEDFRPVDAGHDFYAAQTWAHVPGRTVWIAWAAHWAHADTPGTSGWSGALTFPRELSLARDETARSGVCLRQQPVREINDLAPAIISPDPEMGAEERLAGDSVHRYRPMDSEPVHVRLALPDPANLPFAASVTLLFGETAHVLVTVTAQSLRVDRRSCVVGSGWDPVKEWRLAAPPENGGHLDLFFDRSLLEIFAAGGTTVATDLVFPPHPLSAIEIAGVPEASITVHKLPETIHRT